MKIIYYKKNRLKNNTNYKFQIFKLNRKYTQIYLQIH